MGDGAAVAHPIEGAHVIAGTTGEKRFSTMMRIGGVFKDLRSDLPKGRIAGAGGQKRGQSSLLTQLQKMRWNAAAWRGNYAFNMREPFIT